MLENIPLDQIIDPEFDVRSWISREGLDELAESIKIFGVIQPLRVIKRDDKYEIQDGHRRYLAAAQIGLPNIPCIIVEVNDDDNEFIKLEANLHRESITPLDQARVYRYLMEEKGLTIRQVIMLSGRSESRVRQILGLFNLDDCIFQALEDKRISENVARMLMQIPKPDMRKYYLSYCLDGGATEQVIRTWVAREKAEVDPPASVYPAGNPTDGSQQEAPLKFKCVCCRHVFDANQALVLHVCGECYTELRRAFSRGIIQSDENEESES